MRLLSTAKHLLAIVICVLAAETHAEDGLHQQDIFVRGSDGYYTYRIPSLVVATNGTLLAFCEGRTTSPSDTGNIDIVLKRSIDGGKSWSAQQIIWDDNGNTCGNPCAVVDQETGVISLLLTRNRGDDHEKEIKVKKSKEGRTVWLSQSKDNGTTWSPPREITSSTKKSDWDWYATGPGIGIQILNGPHKGRLVVPCDYSHLAGTNVIGGSHVIYSDDHGKTWRIGGTAEPGMNECQVVELADGNGSLLLSMRNHPSGAHRAQSISRDGGLAWTKPAHNSDLIDPTCEASILRYNWPERKTPGRILFSNPSSTRRRNMSVKLSYDEGKSWPISKTLHEKDAAYSCLAKLPNGNIGCLYERGETNAYEKITFAQFPLSWLETGVK